MSNDLLSCEALEMLIQQEIGGKLLSESILTQTRIGLNSAKN